MRLPEASVAGGAVRRGIRELSLTLRFCVNFEVLPNAKPLDWAMLATPDTRVLAAARPRSSSLHGALTYYNWINDYSSGCRVNLWVLFGNP